ncbi:hypothetical protein ACIHFD_42000 [Nonomuraea sp. NPDC051941]|uniref:arsenate reductase/protein-tyrosine-phosphatase family protein n=1 Tax=Nonomuraea sp. NPDC051941 TaxID=3364373 RepID=UPI0037CBF9CC
MTVPHAPEVLPQVLLVCLHNAGRSRMAAALLHHHLRGRVAVRSAGSVPADTINLPDMALIDVRMPVVDGIEATRRASPRTRPWPGCTSSS